MINWYKIIKSQNLVDMDFDISYTDDYESYYEDIVPSKMDDLFYGRNVIWIGEKGRVLKLSRDQVYPISGNIFNDEKISAVVSKIQNADERVYFYCPYGSAKIIDFSDIIESINYEDEDYGTLTTGNEELDNYIREGYIDSKGNVNKNIIKINLYDEDSIDEFNETYNEIQDMIKYATEYEDGDIGRLIFQIRDGNHRAFGAFASGEPYVYAMISNSQLQDMEEGFNTNLRDYLL